MKQEEDYSEDYSTRRRLQRAMELAAMFKEIGHGSMFVARQVIAKFSLQEGLRKVTAESYFEQLKDSGLITVTYGDTSWKYHSEVEWELFKVEICQRKQ
jgi:hypothetical protein